MTKPRKPRKATRAELAQAAAERRLLAPFMAETHRALGFWRACKRSVCRRKRGCCGNVEACGARLAPQRWSWVQYVVAAIREGHSRPAAVRLAVQRMLGIKKRLTIHFGSGEPERFLVDEQGRWIRPEHVPQKVQLGTGFQRLTGRGSRWMRSAPESLPGRRPSAGDVTGGARRDRHESGLPDQEHVEIELWAKPAAAPRQATPTRTGENA